MPAAPLPPNEAARLTLLQSYAILDTPGENTFGQIVIQAASLFGVPLAALTLVDRDRVWYKAQHGFHMRELPRSVAFCAHAILGDSVLVAEDLSADARFADSPLVAGGPAIRFYAGAPIISPRGGRLGALCVMDQVPRPVAAEQVKQLARLARAAMVRLEVRLALADTTRLLVLPHRLPAPGVGSLVSSLLDHAQRPRDQQPGGDEERQAQQAAQGAQGGDG